MHPLSLSNTHNGTVLGGLWVIVTFKKPHSKSTPNLEIKLSIYLFSKAEPQEILSFLTDADSKCIPRVTSP